MSCITKSDRQRMVAVAFDEASEELSKPIPDHAKARGILERAMPANKVGASHIYQALASRPGVVAEDVAITLAAERITVPDDPDSA